MSFSMVQGQVAPPSTDNTCENQSVNSEESGRQAIKAQDVADSMTGYLSSTTTQLKGYRDAVAFYADVFRNEPYPHRYSWTGQEKLFKNQALRAIAQAEMAINFAKAVHNSNTSQQQQQLKEIARLVDPSDNDATCWVQQNPTIFNTHGVSWTGQYLKNKVKTLDKYGSNALTWIFKDAIGRSYAPPRDSTDRSHRIAETLSPERLIWANSARTGSGDASIKPTQTLQRTIDELEKTADAVLLVKQLVDAQTIANAAQSAQNTISGDTKGIRTRIAQIAIAEVFEGNYIQNEIARLTTEFYELVNLARAQYLKAK